MAGDGLARIAAERRRQVEAEGWTPEHDDRHGDGSLARAAMCYLRASSSADPVSNLWPWERRWWKPKDRISNLVRAGALLVAEQDRRARLRTFGGRPWPTPVEIPFLLEGIAAEIDRLLRARSGGDR